MFSKISGEQLPHSLTLVAALLPHTQIRLMQETTGEYPGHVQAYQ